MDFVIILQLLLNIVFIISVLLILYFFMKKLIKKFMWETLAEFEKHQQYKAVFNRVDEVRNKYGYQKV